MSEHTPCFACNRRISARLPRLGRLGKAKARHKCPHGVWCISGKMEGSQGHNYAPVLGSSACVECYWDKRRREVHGR